MSCVSCCFHIDDISCVSCCLLIDDINCVSCVSCCLLIDDISCVSCVRCCLLIDDITCVSCVSCLHLEDIGSELHEDVSSSRAEDNGRRQRSSPVPAFATTWCSDYNRYRATLTLVSSKIVHNVVTKYNHLLTSIRLCQSLCFLRSIHFKQNDNVEIVKNIKI